jgi:hypothetical protein
MPQTSFHALAAAALAVAIPAAAAIAAAPVSPEGRLALAWHGKLPAAGAPSPHTVFLRLGTDNGRRWNEVMPSS